MNNIYLFGLTQVKCKTQTRIVSKDNIARQYICRPYGVNKYNLKKYVCNSIEICFQSVDI